MPYRYDPEHRVLTLNNGLNSLSAMPYRYSWFLVSFGEKSCLNSLSAMPYRYSWFLVSFGEKSCLNSLSAMPYRYEQIHHAGIQLLPVLTAFRLCRIDTSIWFAGRLKNQVLTAFRLCRIDTYSASSITSMGRQGLNSLSAMPYRYLLGIKHNKHGQAGS